MTHFKIKILTFTIFPLILIRDFVGDFTAWEIVRNFCFSISTFSRTDGGIRRRSQPTRNVVCCVTYIRLFAIRKSDKLERDMLK
jgi:hypothetical protein